MRVGPYAVIEAGARIGRGTTIDAHVVVKGSATIGEDCRLHAGAVIGDDPQDLAFEREIPSRVRLADGVIVREHATIHRATTENGATRIGRGTLIMGAAHVAHDCQIGEEVVICNAALIAGHVQIEDRAFISGNTVIHQFCRVGRLVMLSGLSGIGRDIGPFLTVAGRSDIVGLNSVGMRRAGLDGPARRRVKDAYRQLFSARTLADGLAAITPISDAGEEIIAIVEFYAGSRRGYSRPPAGHAFGG